MSTAIPSLVVRDVVGGATTPVVATKRRYNIAARRD